MGHELRDYQKEAVAAVVAALRRGVNPLLVAPTGAGKTVMAAAIIQAESSPCPARFFAHRTELLEQAGKTFDAWSLAVRCLSVFGNHPEGQPLALNVFDEAHHAVAASWADVRGRFPGPMVAITATPDRADRQRLEAAGFTLIHEIPIRRLIDEGHLVRPLAKKMDVEVDPASFARTAPLLAAAIVDEVARHDRKRTMVFLPDVVSSETMARELVALGVRAAHIDGATEASERADIVSRFKSGALDTICNVNLLTEGFDCPEVDCVVLLRDTQSRALWSQMIGRGLRTASGKKDCLILDPLWVSGVHALTPADAFTEHPDAVCQPRKGHSDPLGDAKGEDDAAEERLLRKLKKASATAAAREARAKGLLDLTQAVPMLGLVPPPAEEGDSETPTWLLRDLERHQLYAPGVTFAQAKYLLDRLKQREGLATLRQVRKLRQFGHRQAHLYTFAQASTAIGSDWRLTGRKKWRRIGTR